MHAAQINFVQTRQHVGVESPADRPACSRNADQEGCEEPDRRIDQAEVDGQVDAELGFPLGAGGNRLTRTLGESQGRQQTQEFGQLRAARTHIDADHAQADQRLGHENRQPANGHPPATTSCRFSRTGFPAGQQQRHEAQREEVKRRDDIVFAAKSKAQVRSNQHKTYRAADQTGWKERLLQNGEACTQRHAHDQQRSHEG